MINHHHQVLKESTRIDFNSLFSSTYYLMQSLYKFMFNVVFADELIDPHKLWIPFTDLIIVKLSEKYINFRPTFWPEKNAKIQVLSQVDP